MSNDRHLQGEYNKLKSKKFGPCTILEKFGDNAYQVELLWKMENSLYLQYETFTALFLGVWCFELEVNFFLVGGTNVEHLHSIDNFSTSSSIDLEQIEEFYLCKTKKSRYEVVYKRKKLIGEKTITNVEVDSDKSLRSSLMRKRIKATRVKRRK